MSLQAPYVPQQVNDAEVVFPAHALDLMPAMDEIPEDFHRARGEARRWVEFQREWFYRGISSARLVVKGGIDKKTALRHLAVIQGSFEPTHQHKEAAVAYLASLWFENPPHEGKN